LYKDDISGFYDGDSLKFLLFLINKLNSDDIKKQWQLIKTKPDETKQDNKTLVPYYNLEQHKELLSDTFNEIFNTLRGLISSKLEEIFILFKDRTPSRTVLLISRS
jgi:hypoxanthine phosphoribosyltransferase